MKINNLKLFKRSAHLRFSLIIPRSHRDFDGDSMSLYYPSNDVHSRRKANSGP